MKAPEVKLKQWEDGDGKHQTIESDECLVKSHSCGQQVAIYTESGDWYNNEIGVIESVYEWHDISTETDKIFVTEGMPVKDFAEKVATVLQDGYATRDYAAFFIALKSKMNA